MPATPNNAASEAAAMRCTGCGGKVGGSVLSRVLARLDIPSSPHVVLGLDHPDDAAILRPPQGRPIVATVDFFAAFLDDPYLVGRVAALNALSDVFALGARAVGRAGDGHRADGSGATARTVALRTAGRRA